MVAGLVCYRFPTPTHAFFLIFRQLGSFLNSVRAYLSLILRLFCCFSERPLPSFFLQFLIPVRVTSSPFRGGVESPIPATCVHQKYHIFQSKLPPLITCSGRHERLASARNETVGCHLLSFPSQMALNPLSL